MRLSACRWACLSIWIGLRVDDYQRFVVVHLRKCRSSLFLYHTAGRPIEREQCRIEEQGKGQGSLFCSVKIWRRASAHKLLTKATIGAVYNLEYMKSSA